MPIFKVQRSLGSNDPDAPWLVYDKGRRHVLQVPESRIPAALRAAMGNRTRVYVVAGIGPDGGGVMLTIDRVVDDQDW